MTASAETPRCDVCNIEADADNKLQQCPRCINRWYCGRKCQTFDWATHKVNCKRPNYVLKIDLMPGKVVDPVVSRTLSCPASATFEDLHYAIQLAFRWSKSLTYDFKIQVDDPESTAKRTVVRMVDREARSLSGKLPAILGDFATKNPQVFHDNVQEVSLCNYFDTSRLETFSLQYEYDYLIGHWLLEITPIGRAPATPGFVCTEGQGNGVALQMVDWREWEDLKNAYRAFRAGTILTQRQMARMAWFEKEAIGHSVGSGVQRIWGDWGRGKINHELELLAKGEIKWDPRTIDLGALSIQY